MIISQKCNCCVHDKICSFKEEYLQVCETIKNSSYRTEDRHDFMYIKDSKIDVNIKCPYMMPQTNYRDVVEIQCPSERRKK